VQAAPNGQCRRLVEVTIEKKCPKTLVVKECHVIPCPPKGW